MTRTLLRIGLFIFIAVMALLSGYIMYDIDTTTEATLEGSEWLIEHESPERDALATDITHWVEVYLRGGPDPNPLPLGERTFDDFDPDRQLPRRLGYDHADSIGDSINDSAYLVTTDRATTRYENTPERHQSGSIYYSSDDRERLESDPAVTGKVYSNGGTDVWIAEGGE